MAKKRDAILMTVTGQKNVGKTFLSKLLIDKYAYPINGVGRKVLIYDVNMEYTKYKTISLKDVAKFSLHHKVEIRRVLPILEDGSVAGISEMMEIMNKILNNFAGGVLLLEDINRYLIGTQTQDIIGTIATNRHRDLDIIVHFQSLSALTPRIWQNCSVIRFHKQQDEIDRYKNRISYFEQLKLAQILVNNKYFDGDIRFYCYVSGEEGYIRGKFKKSEILKAAIDYVNKYVKEREIKTIENKFKKDKNPRQKAIKQIAEDLVKKYNK